MLIDGQVKDIKLSVVLPTYNEGSLDILPKILSSLSTVSSTEVIVVDGGSTDQTLDILQNAPLPIKLLHLPNSSRAQRLNFGIEACQGEMILLHHPRSLIDSQGLVSLLQNSHQKIWGGFTHVFDSSHWLLNFTSWYSNCVRFKRGVIYLDHCIFFHRAFADGKNTIPSVDIFEDTELSYRLNKLGGQPRRLPFLSTTSAVRFLKNGIFRQALINQFLKVGFHLRISHQRMNKNYEKNLNLNNSYPQRETSISPASDK